MSPLALRRMVGARQVAFERSCLTGFNQPMLDEGSAEPDHMTDVLRMLCSSAR